ncbi:unnamed protein product [Echinostoma caproni]|uniref:N(4)-(Beta-N-acetylglucosaminyl)-L-asparaginase n=1 Tax=Echinostoma caproni TaxID=27848 RepID=A0A183A969_9TREM|nr:unnamed protein product [Echinostoma caproni]
MANIPIVVVNTWPITSATDAAWHILTGHSHNEGVYAEPTALNAVVAGCTAAEEDRTVKTVGYGCCPDEDGHTTLDAMVMDGRTMEVGAVAVMPDILHATQVAREVLLSTKHTLLAGQKAADFARSRGFQTTSLDSPESFEFWKKWKENNCQPNFRKPGAWMPDPSTSGGPYVAVHGVSSPCIPDSHQAIASEGNHDTIGLIALDATGSLAVGVSTTGLRHKIPGRVGDSPIPGAGGYANNEVLCLLGFWLGIGAWSGAVVALTPKGEFGAASVGFPNFQISVRTQSSGECAQIIPIPSMKAN